MDELVSDIFGFHALQLGMPELQALRANRMQHRWLALDTAYQGLQAPQPEAAMLGAPVVWQAPAPAVSQPTLWC